MKIVQIKRLRPTQATHGRREVQQKTGEYVALEGHDLDMAIGSQPILVVLHRQALSLISADIDKNGACPRLDELRTNFLA
jgi:hypothetical protein